MDEAGGLTLRVLGELDAIRDGAVVDLGGRRQRAALAALIIARGDVVSAETPRRMRVGRRGRRRAMRAACTPTSATCGGACNPTPAPAAAPTSSAGSAAATPSASDRWTWTPGSSSSALEAAADLPASERVRQLDRGAGTLAGPGVRGVRRRALGGDRDRPADRAAGRRPRAADGRAAGARRQPAAGRPSSRRWSPRTRCARSAGACWFSRCTGRTGRVTRWWRCAGRGRPWPSELGVEPGPGVALAGTRRARPSRRRSTVRRGCCTPALPSPHSRRCRRPAAPTGGTARPAGASDLVDRDHELAALRACRRRRAGRQRRHRADRGVGRHRQDPPAGGDRSARRRSRSSGAPGQGQRAGAGVRLRHRAAAVRTVAGGPGPARRAARRRGGGRARGIRGGRRRRARRRVVRRAARAVLADGQPDRPTVRCCCRSTTCSGATPPRCGSSPTW